MSIFSRSTFSAAGYAAFRPSYPPKLFQTVLTYHHSPITSSTLLDLGCGHGLIARELSPRFERVFAIDPSAGMVKQAQELTKDSKITFRQGSAEDLSFLPEASVDMAVAGQAAHWFDYKKVWPELARVVRSGGSLAFWGYKDNILVGYPEVNAIFDQYCYGEDEVVPGMKSMAEYWEQPGRTILRDSLQAIVPPETEWKDIRRIVYDPDRARSEVGNDEAGWLRKTLKLGEFESYVRTFSSYQGWRDAHPEFKSRKDGGEGDIVDVLFDKILDAVPKWKAKGKDWKDIEVDSYWGTAIILAKRI